LKPWSAPGANENRDSKDNPAQAEHEGAFAVEKESQGDMKRRRHSGFFLPHALYGPLPNELSGPQFILVRDHHQIALPQAVEHFRKLQRAISDLDCALFHHAVSYLPD